MDNFRDGMIGLMLAGMSIVGIDRYTHETVFMQDIVKDKTVNSIIKELYNDGELFSIFKRLRLVLDTPGGAVNDGDRLISHLESSGRHITTEIHNFAASMGAVLFLVGDNRLMNKEAKILFHQIRIMLANGDIVTLADLEEIVKSGRVLDNSPLKDKEEMIVAIVKDMFQDKLEEYVKHMRTEEDEHVKYIAKRIGKSESFVKEHLVRPNEDITLTAKQALEMNIATGIL